MKRIITQLAVLFLLLVGSLVYCMEIPKSNGFSSEQYCLQLSQGLVTSTCESCYLDTHIEAANHLPLQNQQDALVVLQVLIEELQSMDEKKLRQQQPNLNILMMDISNKFGSTNIYPSAQVFDPERYREELTNEYGNATCPIFFFTREIRQLSFKFIDIADQHKALNIIKECIHNLVKIERPIFTNNEHPNDFDELLALIDQILPKNNLLLEQLELPQHQEAPVIKPIAMVNLRPKTPINRFNYFIYGCVTGAFLVVAAWIVKSITSLNTRST